MIKCGSAGCIIEAGLAAIQLQTALISLRAPAPIILRADFKGTRQTSRLRTKLSALMRSGADIDQGAVEIEYDRAEGVIPDATGPRHCASGTCRWGWNAAIR